MGRLRKHFYKLLYRLGVLKPYWEIDRFRYLKRAIGSTRLDWRYIHDEDFHQLGAHEVVIRCDQFTSAVLFYCDRRSKIEQDIIKGKGYQPEVTNLLFDHFRDDSIFLDVGANIGFFSIVAAKQFPRMSVHAFEPNLSILERFDQNIKINLSPKNLQVFRFALSNVTGDASLYAPSPDEHNQGTSSIEREIEGVAKPIAQVIETKRIDELYETGTQPIAVIKIDVQGHETEVLRGGNQTIRRFRPAIILEHEDYLFSAATIALNKKRQLKSYFQELGYTVFYVSRYGSGLLAPVQWERPLNGDLLALPN